MRRISEHVGRHMQLNRTSARDRQTDNIHIKTERERGRRSIDPPDTEEKWRLHVTKILWWMIALVASGVPPILRWYFDGLIDVDTMTSLPEVRRRPPTVRTRRTSVIQKRLTTARRANQPPWWMIPLFTAGRANTWKNTVFENSSKLILELAEYGSSIEVDGIESYWRDLKKKKLSKEYTLISRFNISNGLEIGVDHVKLEEESNRVFRIWWWWWRRYTMMVLHFFYVVLFAATLEKSWRKLSTKLLSDSSCKTILGM